MKKFLAIALLSLLFTTSSFAATNVVYKGFIGVKAPKNAVVEAESRGQYDLTFKALPSCFFRKWYSVKTNVSGAGSGVVTVSHAGKRCRFDIFYSPTEGWKAIDMDWNDYCHTKTQGKVISLELA